MKSPNQGTSWGNLFTPQNKIFPLYWQDQIVPFEKLGPSVLPYGNGRSYGDSCLNHEGTLLSTQTLDRFLSFDEISGRLVCESGVTLSEILFWVIPKGFFIPITLGTQNITVGGAIANDVHGKNHHRAGSFGCHIRQFELLRSNGEKILCSLSQNAELFKATIGGLGLTGIILWVEIFLPKIPSPWIEAEWIPFFHIEEFFDLSQISCETYDHSAGWVDFLSKGKTFGRGIFFRGNFSKENQISCFPKTNISIPMRGPDFLLNSTMVSWFNRSYFWLKKRQKKQRVNWKSFFFPLDHVEDWNRLYGTRGFFQYQLVVPLVQVFSFLKEFKKCLEHSSLGSFLSVIKVFGPKVSPGMLSFPMEGVTFSLDFPNQGEKTRKLFLELDALVINHGGRLYPAKDARMSSQCFEEGFPHLHRFCLNVDPRFSSNFWRRMMQTSERNYV